MTLCGIEIKGSEGRKDTRRDGIESPDLYGSYGPTDAPIVEIVNDAVEGTSFASRNIPGSTSNLAATLQKNGFLPMLSGRKANILSHSALTPTYQALGNLMRKP